MPDLMDFLDPAAAEAYRRAAYNRQAQQGAAPVGDSPLSNVAPEEQQSLFNRMLDSSLGGLAYLGKVADKTFGGRAIRGLLGGRPEEALSIIPGSDTLGLTNENNVVQGTDLLRHLGVIGHDDGWQNQVAGFGAELLTDPSTFLGIGAATKAGEALAKSGGKLAPTLSGRIAAGQASLLDVGLPFQKSLFGIDRANIGTGPISESIARNFWKPVTEPARIGADLAEQYPGRLAEKVIGFNPVTAAGNLAGDAFRFGKSQFDTRVLGTTGRAGQDIAESVVHPEYQQLLGEARKRYADAAVDIERIGQESGPAAGKAAQQYLISKVETPIDWTKNVTERVNKWTAEGLDPAVIASNKADLDAINQQAQAFAAANGPQAQKWAAVLNPQQIAVLDRHADEAGQTFLNLRAKDQMLGINAPDNMDLLEYLTRQRAEMPKQPNEGLWAYNRRATADFNARNKFQQDRLEEFHDLPGGTLQLNEFIKDPELSGKNRTLPGLAVQDWLARQIGGKSFQQSGQLIQEKAKDLAATLKKMDGYWVEKDKDFFKLDLAGNRLTREMAAAKNQSAAEGVYEAAKQYARPDVTFKQGESIPLTKVIDSMGLTGVGPGGVRTAWEQVANRMGLPNIDDVKNLHLPVDLARDLTNMGKAWVNPQEMTPLLHAWDAMANLFKTGVTAVFPAFHVRNAFSGLFNTFRDDAFSLKSIKESSELLRGGHLSPETIAKLYPGQAPSDATDLFMKELIANRVSLQRNNRTFDQSAMGVAGDQVMKLPTMNGQPQSMLQVGKEFVGGLGPTDKRWETIRREYLSPTQIAGVGADEDVNKFVKAGRSVGNAIEDTIRTSHYMEKRLQGFAPEVAAESVAKYHIDYSRGTQAEKNLYKRIFPWFSFSAGNLPPILEQLTTSPGKIDGALRLISGVRDPSEFAPSYLAEGASIPIGGQDNGVQRYLTSFGLPLEDEGVKALGSILRGDVSRTAQIVMGAANPAVKILPEQAFGTQLFSGRKLSDLRPSDLASLGGIIPDQTARALDQVISNSPASRVFHTGDTLLDSRKDTIATLLNIGTGVKLSDINYNQQSAIASRQLAQDQLRDSTKARTRTEVYVPTSERGNLTQDEALLLDVIKASQKRITDQQKIEKDRQPGR